MRRSLPILAVFLSTALAAAPLRAQETKPPAAIAASAADASRPAPGTWGLGFHGLGGLYNVGQPSVRYVATENWAFELTPFAAYTYSHQSPASTAKSYSTHVFFDVLRKLATIKALDVRLVIEPGFGFNYNRTDSMPFDFSKSYRPSIDLNAGLEFEYFARRDLSVSARAMVTYDWVRNASYSPAGTNGRDHSALMGIQGESLALHYYFEGAAPSDDKPVSAVGPGSWALGWQGFGGLYPSDYQPSLKYVWSDKTAFEIIPELSWTHTTNGATYNHNQSWLLPVDIERKLWTRGPLVLTGVVEPNFGTAYADSKDDDIVSNKSMSWMFGIGAGPEIEYFLLSNLSLGARAMLTYEHTRAANYSEVGPGGLSTSHRLRVGGQIFSVRWYFAGKGAGGS